jgi:recombination associated protein RdgC
VGDALLDEIADGEDPAARLDAEFAIMALQLRELIARLGSLFALAAGPDRTA